MASRLPRAPSSKSAARLALRTAVPRRHAKSPKLPARKTPGARSILDAAVTLFATDGFDSVSISQIAAKAGVSKANVFHHFESKQALYLAVMKHACTAHANFAEDLHRLPISSVAKLKQVIDFELKFGLDNPQLVKMTTREMIDGHARVKILARNTMKRNFLAMTALIEQGIRSGEFAADLDPTLGAMLAHCVTTYFFMMQHVLRAIPETTSLAEPEHYAEQLSTLMLKSISASN